MENSTLKNLALLRDPKAYLENFCRIKGKKPGELIPFILKEHQKDLFNTIKNYSRIIILKARQLGTSTAVVGWIYHNTIFNPGTTSAIIGYNTQLTAELLDKVKTFVRSTPLELRPTIHFDSKWEMSFPRIDSKILVLPSTENVGRGYCLHNVLATELSSWENQEEKMVTLEAAVPINGKLIVESTPRGIANHYAKLWMNKHNDYVKKEYGWWLGYTREEFETLKRRINNPMKFAQEMELAFLSSGLSVFDNKKVEAYRKNILKVGDIVKDEKENYKVVEDNGWRIYKKSNPEHFYVCGVDPADGVEGGDYSAAIILDRTTGEEVAFYHRRIPQYELAKKLNEMGRIYNNALMVVEMNSGSTTMLVLKELLYPNPYFRQSKLETLGQTVTDRLGWRTTNINRGNLINDFDRAFRENSIVIHSEELLNEMLAFVYDKNGDPNAEGGYHDDIIFAISCAIQGFKVLHDRPLDQISYEKYLPTTFAY